MTMLNLKLNLKLKPREKAILSVAIFALLAYGFYFYQLMPYNNKISQANNKITALQAKIDQNERLIAQLPKYTARKVEIQSIAESVEQALPPTQEVPAVLNDLQQVFAHNGVQMTTIGINLDAKSDAKTTAQDPSLDVKTVDISFSGTYPAIVNLINSLEKNIQRTYAISDLTLTSNKGAVSGTMTVQVYFAKNALQGYEYKPLLETKGRANPFAQ